MHGSMLELIQALAVPAILVGYRFIAPGDEAALRPEEAASFERAIVKVRRQSGAARIVARQLLKVLGHEDAVIAKAASGAPVWPQGIAGSLDHDNEVAVAAVARTRDFLSVGVDVEPAEPLRSDLVDMIATHGERARYAPSLLHSRQLFAAKEAVYKAVHPLDGRFLEFQDIEVDLDRQEARISYGRTVPVNVLIGRHVTALAFVKGDPAKTL